MACAGRQVRLLQPHMSEDPSCRPPEAACSPVAPTGVAGSGAAPSPGAGRRVAGSVETLEPASSFALRFPAALADERWGAVEAPPRVLRLSVGTAGLFFFLTLASQASQAKVLTGGGDLREAQVDVPLSASHSCV